MRSDIKYLLLAIEKHDKQENLAQTMNWIISNLNTAGDYYTVTQRRISSWLKRDNKVPPQMIYPLCLALKHVGINVPLSKISAGIYPKPLKPEWFTDENYKIYIKNNSEKPVNKKRKKRKSTAAA